LIEVPIWKYCFILNFLRIYRSNMATFTTTETTGDVNDGGTFGNTSPGVAGTDYPNPAGGDDIVVSAGDELTVPSGYSTILSGNLADSTTGDHGKLIVVGTLTLDNNLTLNDWNELNISPGGTLDLDGNDVILGIDNVDKLFLNFIGTSESRCTVTSTTPGGAFARGLNAGITPDMQYADFTNLGAGYLGHSFGVTADFIYQNCTFDNNAKLTLVNALSADSDFKLLNCDFGGSTVADAIELSATTAPSTGKVRQIDNCTFDGGGTATNLRTFVVDLEIINSVLIDYKWTLFNNSGNSITNSFLWNETGAWTSVSPTGCAVEVDNCFIYGGNHNVHSIFTGTITGSKINNNVFEGENAEIDFILPGSSGGGEVLKNILIGKGVLVNWTANNAQTLTIEQNTVYVSDVAVGALAMTEGTAVISGTKTAYSNLCVDSDTDIAKTGVDFVNAAAQLVSDYNNWYGYDAGDWNDRYDPDSATTVGANELNVDPQFQDKTRNAAAWDTSLGGAGTIGNIKTELLKLNESDYDSNYTVADLLTYIRYGFAPTNADLQGTGKDGADIGAVDVVSAVGGIVTPIVTDIATNIVKTIAGGP
jgi:hypothetical protein